MTCRACEAVIVPAKGECDDLVHPPIVDRPQALRGVVMVALIGVVTVLLAGFGVGFVLGYFAKEREVRRAMESIDLYGPRGRGR